MNLSKKNTLLIVLLLVFILKINSIKEKFCTNSDCNTICENNGYGKGRAIQNGCVCDCKDSNVVVNDSVTSNYNSVTYSNSDINNLANDLCNNGYNVGTNVTSNVNEDRIICTSQIPSTC